MPVYVMSFATVDDPDVLPDYQGRAREIVHRYGGDFVARGLYEETLEGILEPSGKSPTTGIIQRWPDRAALERMLSSPEYAILRAERAGIMTATVVVFRDLDEAQAGEL